MNQSLAVLESRRKSLYLQLEDLEDFRRGTVSVNYRKCGKRNCACAREDHPGHGPQYLWNVSIDGNTKSKNIPLGPELEKVESEVQRYRIFVDLCQKIVAVNDESCQLRPVPVMDDENELEQLKKNCAVISPRSGRRSRASDRAHLAGPPKAGELGSRSQRNGHPCGNAPVGQIT